MGISDKDKEIMINRIVERARTIDNYELLRRLYILALRLTDG